MTTAPFFKDSRINFNKVILYVTVILGIGGLSGCGSISHEASITNTKTVSAPANREFEHLQQSEYVTAPSLTKKWMQIDTSAHSLTVSVVLSGENLSLDGYYHGFAEIEIPVGWKVHFSFTDQNPNLSGKFAIVKPRDMELSHVTPAFSGAITPNISNNKPAIIFQIRPLQSGTYKVEFISLAPEGAWLWLYVNSQSDTPEMKVKHSLNT